MKKKSRKAILCLMIFLMTVLLAVLTASVPVQAAAGRKVRVASMNPSVTRRVSSDAVIRDVVTVRPAHPCKLRLQRYEENTGKWVTKKTYSLTGSTNGKLTIEYPSAAWKSREVSRWRIYIPKTPGYRRCITDTVTIRAKAPSSGSLDLKGWAGVILRASDGSVVYGKDRNERYANASTTKMMTALLILESGRLSETTKISKKAAATGWGCLYAKAGTKFRVKDLLYALMLSSSNDAASCLAEFHSGSISAFGEKMTRRARQLGCRNTHFLNPHGLDEDGHYSSAYDLALIQRECLKHKEYREIIQTEKYTFSSLGKNARTYHIESLDELLGTVPGFLGGKTGTTEEALYCFCGVYRVGGEEYIFTVLGDVTPEGRWEDSRKLMKFIRKNFR